MNLLKFVSGLGIAKAGKLGEKLTTMLVESDPETASQVDIDAALTKMHDVGMLVAESQEREEKDHKAVTTLLTRLATLKAAATAIGSNPSPTAQNTADLSKLLDEIESIGGPNGDGTESGKLFDANADHVQSEKDLHDWQVAHAGLSSQIGQMKSALEHARSDMARARDQEQRAIERAAQAERDAGLKSGLDTTNVALGVMQKTAEEARMRARAMTMTAEGLKTASGGDVDDIAKRALAASSTPVSAADRLAKLTGKTAA